MNAHELIEKAREAQELLDRAGLGNRRSALDPDPRLLFDLIKQAQRPEIQYFLRQQRVNEEAMERFLQQESLRNKPREISLNITIQVDKKTEEDEEESDLPEAA